MKTDSIYLKTSMVEPILISCIHESSIHDVYTYVQNVCPNTTESETKEHLFYLINGSFVEYNGTNKTYLASQDGILLLDMIYTQNKLKVTDYSNLKTKVG